MYHRLQEPGKALAAKLCAHLRPKCHALLLDASISSAICVRRNIFQMALLAAMKLHCQVSMHNALARHMHLYILPLELMQEAAVHAGSIAFLPC